MRLRFTSRLAILLAVVLGLSGCASTGGGSGGSSGGSRNLITLDELSDPSYQAMTALEAVRRLRPRWVRPRGASNRPPTVFLDGSQYGDLQTLTGMRVTEVEEIRFIDSRDATMRYGTGFPSGIIAVSSRR